MNIDPLIPLREVCKARNRGRSSTYSDVAAGLLTQPVKTPSNAWPESEIRALNTARIAGKSDHEIRALVATLHAQRMLHVATVPCGVPSHVTSEATSLKPENGADLVERRKGRGRPAPPAQAQITTAVRKGRVRAVTQPSDVTP